MGCALVLAAVSLSTGGWLSFQWRQDHLADAARSESAVVAGRAVKGMYGYDFRTIDTQMAQTAEDMTPSFRDNWLKVTATVLAPGAKEQELVVEATVLETGIISAEADRTEVMVFMNQMSSGKNPAAGSFDTGLLRVSMERDDGRWLVAAVDPV